MQGEENEEDNRVADSNMKNENENENENGTPVGVSGDAQKHPPG